MSTGLAWGSGLFESDRDCSLIEDLDAAAGLVELEKAANDRPFTNGVSHSGDHPDDAQGEHSYSMYSDRCATDADRLTVRTHLDSGALATLIRQWQQTSTHTDAHGQPMYSQWDASRVFIIGACAMTHGCRLDHRFLNFLVSLLPSLNARPTALQQMQRALLSATERYRNDGTPYDFGSLPRPGMEELDDEYPDEVLAHNTEDEYVLSGPENTNDSGLGGRPGLEEA